MEAGITGRLVAPGDLAGFAEAFRTYSKDPALRTRHGRAGEAEAATYSWDQINQAVADTYLRLVSARSG